MILGLGILAAICLIIGIISTVLIIKDRLFYCSIIVAVVSFILMLLFFIFGILLPIDAKKCVVQFEYTREIVQEAYENGTELDNVAITNKIIEANEWLASAKADKKSLGIFSQYYNIDLDNIEPITINK